MSTPDVEAMVSQMAAPTAALADFLPEYEKDDNIWWAIACGHHMNLFDAAVEERDELKTERDTLTQKLAYLKVELDALRAKYLRDMRQAENDLEWERG